MQQQDARAPPAKVISLAGITLMDVIEERNLLIILSEHIVIAFPLDSLNEADPHRRSEVLATNAATFQLGHSMGLVVLAIVKNQRMASTVKIVELVDLARPARSDAKPSSSDERGSSPPRSQHGHIYSRPFKKVEHPIEVRWLRLGSSKMCIGCVKGISLVDLETLDTQDVIDPSYASPLSMVEGDRPRPLAMFRIDDEYLLCYDVLAFFVNSSGGRARQSMVIYWEGSPASFSLRAPYIFAFSAGFIEVRNVVTGELVQTIHGQNIRCLTQPSDLRGTASIGDTAPPPYEPDESSQWEDPLIINVNEVAMQLQRI